MKHFDYPKFYSLLSSSDKISYMELVETIDSVVEEFKRKKNEKIKRIFSALKTFINKSVEDVWKRALVCGMYFISANRVAINSRQIQKLTHLSKTTVNTYLNEIGYHFSTDGKDNQEICQAIPFLRSEPLFVRQWTVRYKNDDDEMDDIISSPVPNYNV